MADYDPFGLDVTPEKKEVETVSQDETGINITYKGEAASYGNTAAPWVVVHAANAEQAFKLHGIDPKGKTMRDLFELVTKTSRIFQEIYTGSPAQAPQPVAAAKTHLGTDGVVHNAPAASAAPAQDSGGEPYSAPPVWMGPAPHCPHSPAGVRKFVSKVGQYGPWAAWGCAAGKDAPESCSQGLIFVKKPKGA